MAKLALVSGMLGVVVAPMFLVASTGFAEQEIAIKVEVSAPFAVEPELEARLQEMSKKLIVQIFPEQCAKSFQARGECNVFQKIEDVYLCELVITFLYKETDTAVLSRVKFKYTPEKVRVYTIEPEYKPEMEAAIPPRPSEEPEVKEKKESFAELKLADVPEDPREYEAILEQEGIWSPEEIEKAEREAREQIE